MSILRALTGKDGASIGLPVLGGTSKSVLYINAAGQLAQDNPNFIYDDALKDLYVGGNSFNQVINTHEIVGCLRWTAGQNGQRISHPFGTVPLISTMANNGSGLIRVTTVYAHGLGTGAQVSITGTVGTTEANANWTVTVIDATNFDLQGSTFANAYVSGGVITAIIGTNDYTLCARIMAPASVSPTQVGIIGITSSTSVLNVANALALIVLNTGVLQFRFFGATSSDQRNLSVNTNFLSTFSGNSVHIAVTRSAGGTPLIYINGTLFATTETTVGTPPAWSDSVAGGNLVIGEYSNTSCWVDRIYNARFYSGIALSQAAINAEMVTGIANVNRWGNLLTATAGCVIDSDLENAEPGTSASVRDISTNAYGGTLSGASTIIQMEPTPQLNTSIFRLGSNVVRSGASGVANGVFVCQANTYQDSATAASGTASLYGFNVFRTPTLSAYNTSVTTSVAATVYIEGPVAAGTNQTITVPLALQIATGDIRTNGRMNMGITASDTIFSITNTKTFITAINSAGKYFNVAGTTITDPVTTSGTIATGAANSFNGPTFAFASGAVTITDATNLYIGDITAGTGATFTRQYSILAEGNIGSKGKLQTRGSSTNIMEFYNTSTAIGANTSIGILQWNSADAQLTTQFTHGNIEVQASQTINTDAAAGQMIFRTTGTTVGGSPVEAARITALQGMKSNSAASINITSTTLTAAQYDEVFNNVGASALTTHTLPTGVAGLRYGWRVLDTDGYKVQAPAGVTIYVGASASTVAGSVQSVVVGSALTLECVNATTWIARELTGTWITA